MMAKEVTYLHDKVFQFLVCEERWFVRVRRHCVSSSWNTQISYVCKLNYSNKMNCEKQKNKKTKKIQNRKGLNGTN